MNVKLKEKTEVALLCPKCQIPRKLIAKTNRGTGTQFLGCPNWPICDHTQPLTEDLIMRALGAVTLPGFE